MFGNIVSLLAGIPAIANGLFAWLNKRTDADLAKYQASVTGDTAVNVEEIRTRVALGQQGLDTRKENNEHWFTAWMVPAAFGVSLAHYSAVVFDSLPWFDHVVGSWHIPALPGQYASMQSTIILTVCGASVTGGVLKRLFAK